MKLIWSLVLLSLVGLTMAGCGEKKSDAPTDTTRQETEDDGGRGGTNWPEISCPPESTGGHTVRMRLMEIKQRCEEMFTQPETPEPLRPSFQQLSVLCDENLGLSNEPPKPDEYWTQRNNAVFQAWTLIVEGQPDEAALTEAIAQLNLP